MSVYQNIVVFGNARWREDMCGNSSQQLSLAFLQMGYRLLYITPNKGKPVSLQDHPKRFLNLSISKKLQNEVWSALKEWSATPSDTVFICSLATKESGDLLRFLSGQRFKIIYRVVDWFDPSNKEHCFDQASNVLACKVSSLIVLSHPDLNQKLSPTKSKVITLTNGVEYDLFHSSLREQEKPPDVVTGDITIGFWGTFWGNAVDWPIIQFLSRRQPEWQFNLIADLQYLDVDRSFLPRNVHFLGLKNKLDLPAYLKYFHLCFVPYRMDFPFAKYSNPIKVLESLAALKPVVAPVNSSLASYPGCFLYTSPEQAEEKIREAASARLNEKEILDFARANTWKTKASKLLEELEQT